MYIRDYEYGRIDKHKGRRVRLWPAIGICILALSMGGITVQVMAGQTQDESREVVMMEEIAEAIEPMQNIMEAEYAMIATEAVSGSDMIVETDKTLVVLDPGHGGEDEGCSGEGVEEKRINLQISLALRDQLMQMGYEVLMTREDDSGVTLEERVKLANDAHADIYISIHQNSCDESNVSGIETWYNESVNGKESKRLAQLIHNNVMLHTEGKDRGLWRDETLYVIRETDMPSCLIETGFLSNAADRSALCNVEYQREIVEGIASGIDLYFNPKIMYLTFDDGPSPENTEKILDILNEKNIKATFFVIGENVRKNPKIAKRIVEEGHGIGIHCDWHDYDKLYDSVESYVADFEKAYETVYEVTGEKVTIFRFPGGSINSYNKKVYKDIIEEMTNRGFIYYDWNASLEDTISDSSPEKLIQNAKESTLGRRKVILLAHDIIDNTVLCLEELLEQFPEYRMELLTSEVEPIQF